jgi:peptidoglycan/LPS O-acetylase OafA/YrhL
MNATEPAPRIHGLDTLRALAISFVLLHHYVLFVSGRPTFGWVGEIGWVGVDLFFALSGYLIGNQIFAALRSGGHFSLKLFYARRLLRTLPNYYVVLALYFIWPAFGHGAALPPLWEFLTFTQNMNLNPGTAFSHAWSLSIEEQFYLLLPAAALLAASMRNGLRLAWAALALVLVAGMLVRAGLWHSLVDAHADGVHNYYKYIYYSSLCRLDELVAGVALALLKNYHAGVWKKMTSYGNLTLACGIAACALTFFLFLLDRYGLAITIIGYPMLAIGFSLLVVAALSPGSILHETRVPGAGGLALCSYALYLTHKQVGILAGEQLQSRGFSVDALPAILVILALSVLSGWLLFRLVETPFMSLRARLVPAGAAPVAALTPRPR